MHLCSARPGIAAGQGDAAGIVRLRGSTLVARPLCSRCWWCWQQLADAPLLLFNACMTFCLACLPAGNGASWATCLGKVSVAELDWTKPEQVAPLQPPFDYVLAADCIYHVSACRLAVCRATGAADDL